MKKLITCLSFALAAVSVGYAAVTPLWMRDARISPDGSEIVFCYKGDIYKVSAQGGTAVQLTTQASYEANPVWSPDGEQIAFASDRNGNFDLFIMSADGGAARRLTYHSASEIPSTFTPDGKYVLFSASIQDPATSALFPTSAMTELYRVPVEGGGIPNKSWVLLPNGFVLTRPGIISFIRTVKGLKMNGENTIRHPSQEIFGCTILKQENILI